MNKKIAFLVSILFVLTLCGIYIFMSHSPEFNLTRIDVKGNHKVSEEEILERAEIQVGTNIFRLDLGRVEDSIREDKRIKEVWVKRKLPNWISIEVEEKKPALWINLPDGLYGLSQDQEIIPLEEEDFDRDLPVITGLTSSYSGKQNQSIKIYEPWSSMRAKFALDFYKILLEEDSSFTEIISEINLSDETNLILYLIPRGIQVNMGKGSYKKKLERMKAILSQDPEFGRSEEKVEHLACIDLRFKDQVVLRNSSQGLVRSSSQKPNDHLAEMKRKKFGGKENL
jgi:cell division septal protein FtsQ